MTGENKFFKYLKIVIGFLVAILFLLPIFILLMDSFKNQKGILTDVLGWPNAPTPATSSNNSTW